MKNKCSYPVIHRTLFIAILGLMSLPGLSQEETTCAENLRNAQTFFDNGQVEQVPGMLSECLKSGFNREEELTAYKLLIQTYLFEDKNELADSVMLAFLKKNPEYELSPTDHSSFVFQYNKFKVKPVIQISIHFGTNLPFITFIDEKSVAGIPGEGVYKSKALNLYTSLEAKIKLAEKLELNIEGGYSQVKFTNIEDFMHFGETTYNETQNRVEIPLTITYNFENLGKFTPYGRFGIGSAFTLASTALAEFTPTDENNHIVRTGTSIDRNDSRIDIDIFVQIGAGIKFKTRGGYILAELRSNAGALNQSVRGGVTPEQFGFFYFYKDDDFHVNALNFNIGYTQIFYIPSKRKE
jgi:hypothetical protein